MKQIVIPVLVFFFAVCCMAYRICDQDKQLKEKDRKIENLEAELTEARIVMVYDSLQMSVQQVQNYTKEEVKEKMPETTVLVENNIAPMKDVESIGKVATATHDTIYIPIDSGRTFSYHDVWTDIIMRDTLLSYESRDSLTTIVYQPYRHHFLWWRWGKKPAEVSIINHNPNSSITYNKYIKVVK